MPDEPAEPLSDASLQALRLFPLPDGVLFPHTVLPLHVFEPRYRAMVADALEGDRVIAVAMLRTDGAHDADGRPAIHDIVGVGRILQVQQVQDGRYYLALEGLCRARVVTEHPLEKPYRLAVAQRLEDQVPVGGVRDGLTTLHTALVRLMAQVPDRSQALNDVLDGMKDPAAVSDVLCAAALEDGPARQHALATLDVGDRLKLATDAVMELMLRSVEEQDPGALVQ